MTMTAREPTRATTPDLSNCPQLEALTVEHVVSPILEAQLAAIWPQERELFTRYALPEDPTILDVGCGTGVLEVALARMWPSATIVGLDVAPKLLDVARRRAAGLGNVAFCAGNGARLPFADETFDVVCCRHVLQAISNPAEVLDEMVRVLEPGGVLHLLPEDYGMLQDSNGTVDTDRLWQKGWIEAGRNSGIDLRIGRKLPAMLLSRGMSDVRVDFVVVDSLRVDREILRRLFDGWRDFANDWVVKNTSMRKSELDALFSGLLATIDDPEGYVVWQVPIVSAVKPGDRAPRSHSRPSVRR